MDSDGPPRKRLKLCHEASKGLASEQATDYGVEDTAGSVPSTIDSPSTSMSTTIEQDDTSTATSWGVAEHSNAAQSPLPVEQTAVDEICAGMIELEVLPSGPRKPTCEWQRLEWDVGTSRCFAINQASPVYNLSTKSLRILEKLRHVSCSRFEFYLEKPMNDAGQTPYLSRRGVESSLPVWVNIYAADAMIPAIGSFLEKGSMCLQQPARSSRHCPYKNPHCLPSLSDEAISTADLCEINSGQKNTDPTNLCQVLMNMASADRLEEVPQPELVRTRLHDYQRRGLSFLLTREKGWQLDSDSQDLWHAYTTRSGAVKYRNNISGKVQYESPRAFSGGVLADDMGLGKTLTMLSLIARGACGVHQCINDTTPEKAITAATLVVVPLSLLSVWERQITEHLSADIRGITYYGDDERRRQCWEAIDASQIVLTTYNVLASDWKAWKQRRKPSQGPNLYARYWHRLVLDEAHMIKTSITQNSQAACAIEASHRWCITGTPVQNRLGDLSTLLRFLRIDPYDQAKVFDKEILRPWKEFEDPDRALRSLQALMKIIALRRSRDVIALPERHDHVEQVEFSEEEAELYARAREGTIKMIDQALGTVAGVGTVHNYLNALQRINDLRSICNHGLRHAHHSQDKAALCTAQQLAAELEDPNQACLSCGTDLGEEVDDQRDSHDDEDEDTIAPNTEASRLCGSCKKEQQEASETDLWSLPLESSHSDTETIPSSEVALPSKLKRAMECLEDIPAGDKCIIMSYWKTTLDMMRVALDDAKISYLCFHGRLAHQKRKETLLKFDSDHSIKVLLLTITCGGQGLDLTAANHAFLLEPQWNPMIEEQAIARVHRLGQTKPIKITRFIVKNTWEEKIITRQERKRVLAGLIMGKQKLRQGEQGRRQLGHLRNLVSL